METSSDTFGANPLPAYEPYGGLYGSLGAESAAGSHTRKRVICGVLLALVLVLVYYVHKDSVYRKKGFKRRGRDARALSIPCTATDHAKVLSATYKSKTDQRGRPKSMNVAPALQTALTGQAGNLSYTVDSAKLTGSASPVPGHLTFKATCPAGIAA